MAQCGDKPQLIAIGIAPLGIISIGVVPMGVVSIGVVPMGVLSIGAVGMGLINACVVGAYPSKQVALQKARELGCEGVHAMGSLWMPCASHPSTPPE
ncbi:MAG: hypothetical protein EB136_09360 [Synechococcaceae bacterium WBB_3_034]|nr:hypothetical protein [Synechococcaceae bacterium WBB_3_034]